MYVINQIREIYPEYVFTVPEIVQYYVDWVSEDQYMILSKWNEDKQKYELYAVKCAKRGNDRYRLRVGRRFKGLCAMADNVSFFNPKDRNDKKTRALWVTLTYDTKKCSFEEAWLNIGIEYNRFMSFIRKRFGKVSCCRTFESFENGYPHVHCILLFENKWFKVFRDRKSNFRISVKRDLEGGWHSNIDVKAMSSLAWGFTYLKKYLLKAIDFGKADSKALKTLALCWAFRKRAFSASGHFRKLLSTLIHKLKGLRKKLYQVNLLGEVVFEIKFHVLGFVPAEIVTLKKDEWFKKLDSKSADKVYQYLEKRENDKNYTFIV